MGDIYTSADYTTLETVKRYIDIGSTLTTDDVLLKDIIRQASDDFTIQCNRSFVPYIATRAFIVPSNAAVMQLPADLLTLSTITGDDGSALVVAVDYELLPLSAPYNSIRRLSGAWARGDTITIAGTWGWHSAPPIMWRPLATLLANITSSATTISPTFATAVDILSYIQVGTEVMQITAVATGNTSYTVTRGELGSTAAAHTAADVINLFHQYSVVANSVKLRTAHLYRIRANPGGERIEGTQGSFTISPKEPPIVPQNARFLRRMIQEGIPS